MAAAIHWVIPDAKAPRETWHGCPYPGCHRTLPASLDACKRHRKAWRAAVEAAESRLAAEESTS